MTKEVTEMDRLKHIQALVDTAQTSLGDVKALYEKSLSAQHLEPTLLIRIKNLLENLRSALDYLAREVFDLYCTQPSGKRRIDVYFPILKKSASITDFHAFMNGRFPGLQQAKPELYSKLEGYQYFASADNEWLLQFNELCQENKHEQLATQTRTEEKQTRFESNSGGVVGWNDGIQFGPGQGITFKPGGRLTFGPGGSIGFGRRGVSIGGRPVNPATQMPEAKPNDKIQRVVWVDFQFAAIGTSAFPFLKRCVNRVRDIVDDIKRLL